MNRASFPILEFDDESPSVIDPSVNYRPNDRMPPGCVLCFFREVLDRYIREHPHQVVATILTEGGPHPIHRVEIDGRPVALAPPGIGAPIAAGVLEACVALGARSIITCGSAGVLDGSREVGRLMIPTSAVRDEGTSYHYLPPSREVPCSPKALQAIRGVLRSRDVVFEEIKTWTTDAFYRETTDKVRARREEGCVAVEMECSALFAVGVHRGVSVGSILYAADDVSGKDWDRRDYRGKKVLRRLLLELSIEACLDLD